MVSDRVVKLCSESATVSSVWAENPTVAPSIIIDRLYGHYPRDRTCEPQARRQAASPKEQTDAAKCGKWGPTAPSPLFLQAFANALNCLDADPQSAVVSPPLMGSHGTMPLTVITPLADVIRHCANLIASAEKEIFFVTCVWSPSLAQKLIRGALMELSRRAQARNQRVKAHFMYDAAGLSNLSDSHRRLTPKSYAAKSVGLPSPEEIPHVDLEVMNVHTIPLGTLHSKFCVVDGKRACIMSNNMADNDNLEMMVQLEGPIVESVRDAALITWYEQLRETDAPVAGQIPSTHRTDISQDGSRADIAPLPETKQAGIASQIDPSHLPVHMPDDAHFDLHLADEVLRIQRNYHRTEGERHVDAANRVLNLATKKPVAPTGPDFSDEEAMTPYIMTETQQQVPMVLVCRPPYGSFGSRNAYVPQNEAWLSLIRNCTSDIFIQTPDLNAAPLLPAILDAIHRGVKVTIYTCFGYNEAGEMIPGQGGTNEQVATSLVDSLSPDGQARSLLQIYNYVGKDQDHPIHQSFKSRSCHIKLLIADGRVGIQGSGNQDTQSWFHSQEVNVMVDSQSICEKWRACIDRNQNTKLFGRVAEDGVWRDKSGNPGEGYSGNPGIIGGLFKGVLGMIRKMEGVGGL
ncbi:IQ calmodulin-binding protein [Cordyceps militaris CM01]|uniref:IQ calmodulin-binding protein n=1 Tax=Cordyceps militaris (strain CM01) TaxID=983644 RepID=G3J6J4_CORMM|nr:IQ calmodulin-binding protein [Cordyceps militaris CM01]EGX97022.1 IQ calmodulin-binding protein [Cordyceps militaris CM01]